MTESLAEALREAAAAQLAYMDLCGEKGDLERNLRAALAAYDAKREAALKELSDLGQAWDAAPPAPDLSDPTVVHLNMLRGTIAKPTVDQIIYIYGIDALCKALAPQIVREAESLPMTDYERKVAQKNKDFPNGF